MVSLFLCGWKGALRRLNISPKGMNVLVYGTIPTGAGLSSSSSVVCAAALITLLLYSGRTFDIISKVEFAEMCAEVERFVGVEGGGMDQAIEVLANEGSAMLINFNPLRFSLVTLPENALFAVIHSGEALNKAATSQYNERVVECRLAAQIAQRLRKTAQEMISVVEKVLHIATYTKDDALRLLDITNEIFKETILTTNTQHMKTFKLAQRAKHVYMEADRVRLFHEACKNGNVEKCLQNGALGARLTGAGWGGCAVALFDTKNLIWKYYFGVDLLVV
ncbi:N-acetylgalactosamine kinase [Dirofilaria immitis]|nr:N-acetylgalactosamine kinase [Dirofilaria immitis]